MDKNIYWVNRKRRGFLTLLLFLSLSLGKSSAQFYSLGVDLVGAATTTFSIEGSMALHNRWSLHLPLQYNPWSFDDNRKKIKQITAQPGIRYWKADSYSEGWFFGLNGIVSRYNMEGFLGSRYQRDGWAYGGGLSAGYSKPIHRRWNVEFEMGVGAVWARYDKYRCGVCGDIIEEDRMRWSVSPNKAAVKLIYLF